MSVVDEIKALLARAGATRISVRPERRTIWISYTLTGERIVMRAHPVDRQIKRFWKDDELQLLRDHYPHVLTRKLADQLGRPERSVYLKAKALGLAKDQAYLDSPDSGRLLKGVRRSPETEFKPGLTPWNKGRKMPDEIRAKCAPTMFKPGRAAHEARNYRPIGSLRISRDGILERKVTDDPSVYPARRWVPVSRLVWEAENGPIPPGHIVRFRDGMQTTVEAEITLDRLECISKSENMRRNSVHNLPAPLPQLVQLKGALVRKIRNRERKRA